MIERTHSMEIRDPSLVVDIQSSRDFSCSIQGSRVALLRLSRLLSESLLTSAGVESEERVQLCGAPVLTGDGRKNDAYLSFWIDGGAILNAEKRQKGIRGFWADSGGCLTQLVLLVLAGKGVISFFS